LQVQGHERTQGLRAEDIRDVLPRALIRLGGEDCCPLSPFRGVDHRNPRTRADASIRLQQFQDFAVFPLDILRQLLPSHRQVFEDGLNGDSRPPLSRNGARSLELPRSFEVEPVPLGSFMLAGCGDVYICKSTERGERLASEAEGFELGEVIVGTQLGGVVLQSDGRVVFFGDTGAVIMDLDGVETVVLEANLCSM